MKMAIAVLLLGSCLLGSKAKDMGDALSLVQLRTEEVSSETRGERDLVFVHVPMNFGNSIVLTAAAGSGSTLTYRQVSQTAKLGWAAVSKITKPNAPVWGPLNPDLQQISELGYPMYYTPGKYWPKALAEQYFSHKTTFGLLRDPYERILGLFRGQSGSVARGWGFQDDGRNCAAALNSFVKQALTPLVNNPSQAPQNYNLHIQADYFEGPYAIQEAVDLDSFPQSANELLQKHGYNINIGPGDLMHVTGCDDTFVDAFNEESKGLIEQYYARDFKLRCEKFGYCDKAQQHCVVQAPGMCPKRLYNWDESTQRYVHK